jgi:hypothetical protein
VPEFELKLINELVRLRVAFPGELLRARLAGELLRDAIVDFVV